MLPVHKTRHGESQSARTGDPKGKRRSRAVIPLAIHCLSSLVSMHLQVRPFLLAQPVCKLGMS
jgi:hypothetical protein